MHTVISWAYRHDRIRRGACQVIMQLVVQASMCKLDRWNKGFDWVDPSYPKTHLIKDGLGCCMVVLWARLRVV